MNVLEAIEQQRTHLIALRRQIHQNPELGWQEHQTQALVLSELSKIGIPCEAVCGTGVLAVIKGARDGIVVGLRADMDALPIEEKNECEYRSLHTGVMHACGHDCHVAMLLVAARVLWQHRNELMGTIKLIFQPAEEIIEGAKQLCALPQLADVDKIVAVHVWADLPVGYFSAEEGPRMACADNIFLTVNGKSAHGAQPHQSVDAVAAACAVVGQLQTIVSRRVNPLEPVVVTLGTIHGGSSSNIIANRVELTGTVRCFSPELRAQLPELIRQIAQQTAQAYGAACEVRYQQCTPPTINEQKTTRIAQNAIAKLFGEQALTHLQQTMGGEDFAWYLERTPGCMVFVGGRNEQTGKCYPHHHECFDIDEQALANGAAFLVQFALETCQMNKEADEHGRG